MQSEEFFAKVQAAPNPVVVDIWAPWCGPCRTLSPRLQQVADEFSGQVDVWKINADEAPGLVKTLGVMGIPTLLLYRNGEEIGRRTGVQSLAALRDLFTAVLADEPAMPSATGLSDTTRFLRLASGVALLVVASLTGWPWVLIGAGVAIMFSAVYDRCPIWKALTARVRGASSAPAEGDVVRQP